MKEILELNARILDEAREQLPAEGVMLRRDDVPEELNNIPAHLVREIDALRATLNKVIPNDFGYLLFLGDSEPVLRLEYNDGGMTSGGRGRDWKHEESIYDQLRELDWD